MPAEVYLTRYQKYLAQLVIDDVPIPGRYTRGAAIRTRDRHCRAPGCTVRGTRSTTVHHVIPQSVMVDHRPSNLMLLCGRHHPALHQHEGHGGPHCIVFIETADGVVCRWCEFMKTALDLSPRDVA